MLSSAPLLTSHATLASETSTQRPSTQNESVQGSDAMSARKAGLVPNREVEIQPSLLHDPVPLGSEPLPPSPLITRAQLVGQILELNPTATPGFLSHFDEESLRDYVEHMTVAQRPREERGGWVRRTNVPAIVMREPAE